DYPGKIPLGPPLHSAIATAGVFSRYFWHTLGIQCIPPAVPQTLGEAPLRLRVSIQLVYVMPSPDVNTRRSRPAWPFKRYLEDRPVPRRRSDNRHPRTQVDSSRVATTCLSEECDRPRNGQVTT